MLFFTLMNPVTDFSSYCFHRFPFIACEIFTCEVDIILKTLVEDEEVRNINHISPFLFETISITLWKLISVTDFFWSLVGGSWWTCCFPFWSQNSPIAHYWLGILARLFFVDFLESSLSSTSVGWSFCRYNFYYHAFYLSPLISSVSFLFQRNYQ